MEQVKRLQRANWVQQIGLPVLILLSVGAIMFSVIREVTFHYLLILLTTMAALLHLVFLTRTRNRDYLVPLLFYVSSALTFLSLAINNKILAVVFAFFALGLLVFFFRLLVLRRLKWRYREVLELAAASINESKNGFTTRPYPAGKVNFSKEELNRFALFALKHVIAFPYFEENRVVLAVPDNMLPHFLSLKKDYLDETFIVFNYDGEVSVQIANKDYRQYTKELTFDQLCSSFANMFAGFLELFRIGKQDEIIHRMNALKLVV